LWDVSPILLSWEKKGGSFARKYWEKEEIWKSSSMEGKMTDFTFSLRGYDKIRSSPGS